jgi:hypothetical protein
MTNKKKSVKDSRRVGVSRSAAKARVKVRTYRHGLGDCHLLTFTKTDGTPFYMLIDCGIVDLPGNSSDQASRLKRMAASIKRVTSRLDVVVATHQHTDHLSGFRQAQDVFNSIDIGRVWMAWTEDKANPLGKQIQQQLTKKLAIVREAAERLSKLQNISAAQAAAHINGILDFFGPAAAGDRTQAILDALAARVAKPDYLEPGMVFPLHEDVPNVRVYILGPPKSAEAMKITNPRKKPQEGYEFALSATMDGLAAALDPKGDAENAHPFDKANRIPEAVAGNDPFFKSHYFAPDPKRLDKPDWRRIESSWLEIAEQLALAVNDYTNNTSLAMAFEFTDTGEVMLFPGDAQIGSWLTWKELEWKIDAANGSKRKVNISDLFARTVFYKAAHHASHNGTLSGLGKGHIGLEQMTSRDLVCVVPVDVQMSIEKHWDRTLPWQPLLDRLQQKTRGRLILTDTSKPAPVAEDLEELTKDERNRFARQFTFGKDIITTEPKGEIDWVEYVL